MRGPIVFLTDFGEGYFQGVMKGVVAQRAPGVPTIDLSHHVSPGSISEAAYILASALPYFPPSSVFVCVVDPGVGSERRRLVLDHPSGPLLLAPDNGLLTRVLPESFDGRLRRIENPGWSLGEASATFQGRSNFAPAAAELATGASFDAAGPLVDDPVLLAPPRLERSGAEILSEVAYVDSFGNLVTAIRDVDLQDWLQSSGDGSGAALLSRAEVRLLRRPSDPKPVKIRGIVRTFSDVPAGTLLAYLGSTGHLEIATRDGNAALELGVDAGHLVSVAKSSS